MTKRVCVTPGCPRLVAHGRCAPCRRAKEQARGTRQERGYDAAHDRLRAHYQHLMDLGRTFRCWRCNRKLGRKPEDWQLGHDDHDRTMYRGPECIKCNSSTSPRRPKSGA